MYERIIKSRTTTAAPCPPEKVPELRALMKSWDRYLRYYNFYLHAYQEELEQSGLYTINLATRQAQIDYIIEACSQHLDGPDPLSTFQDFRNKHYDEFMTVAERLDGDNGDPETDPEARLRLKLKALELWGPFVELINFYLVLLQHMIEMSVSAAAVQELKNKLIEENYSQAQGRGEVRPS